MQLVPNILFNSQIVNIDTDTNNLKVMYCHGILLFNNISLILSTSVIEIPISRDLWKYEKGQHVSHNG